MIPCPNHDVIFGKYWVVYFYHHLNFLVKQQ